jgi:hypothetical protein
MLCQPSISSAYAPFSQTFAGPIANLDYTVARLHSLSSVWQTYTWNAWSVSTRAWRLSLDVGRMLSDRPAILRNSSLMTYLPQKFEVMDANRSKHPPRLLLEEKTRC